MKQSTLTAALCLLFFSFLFLSSNKISGQSLSISCPPSIVVPCFFDVPPPNPGLVSVNNQCPNPGVIVTWEGDVESEEQCPNKVIITRTYRAINNCGQVRFCTQTITVFDNIPPVITCPPDIIVKCRTQVPPPNFAGGTATDNCLGVQVTHVFDDISENFCQNKVNITRSYRAVDGCGNEAYCTQKITVFDDVPPVITCPPDIVVKCKSEVPLPNFANGVATDNCGEVTVTHEGDQIHNVICENRYLISRRYKAVDDCGNESFCTQNITVHDDIPPAITCPPDITVACTGDIPPRNFAGGLVGDNCGPVTVTWEGDEISDVFCVNKRTITRSYKATDACGNEAHCVQVITVNDNKPPTITCPGDITVQCPGDVPLPNPLGLVVSDNCPGTIFVSHISDVIINKTCANRYEIKRTYRAKDVCNNVSFCTQTIYVFDNTPPVITSPPSITIPFSSTCGYVIPNLFGYDNCPGPVWLTWTDVKTWCGNELEITRTWIASDDCGNSIPFIQTITVTDNPTRYIIYANKEAKFGESNLINGDVGVTDANGNAHFKKNSVLDPYDLYAKKITVQLPATVNNKHFVPATGGPTPPWFGYSGGGLSGNHTQSVNGIVPAGNFKNLTIKKGVTATVNGSNYGKVTIEENADATFTSGSINMEELIVKKGKASGTSDLHFTGCTGIKIKDGVDIGEDSRINNFGPKVIFYLPSNKVFSVKAGFTEVTANIHGGKLSIDGKGGATMNGWYLLERLESSAKDVTWNPYDCKLAQPAMASKTSSNTKSIPLATEMNQSFNVSVYPNPSNSEFSLIVKGSMGDPVMIRIFDISGKTIQTIRGANLSIPIRIGASFSQGIYFAEVRQGNSNKTIRLVKME